MHESAHNIYLLRGEFESKEHTQVISPWAKKENMTQKPPLPSFNADLPVPTKGNHCSSFGCVSFCPSFLPPMNVITFCERNQIVGALLCLASFFQPYASGSYI